MSQPAPDSPSPRKLVWAPEAVRVQVEEPPVGVARLMTMAVTTAMVLSWPPIFLVLAGATLVAPAVTDRAGIGATAGWAAQIAVLVAVGTMITAVVRRGRVSEGPDGDTSLRTTALRVALHSVVTGGCAALVLAWHGLGVGQVLVLVAVIVTVVHVLPVVVARVAGRAARRRR
ncbi:hypothetical protein [Micromonospora yangpuensis]|uniref:Uncharacterized protein n=1 Tax=Micromonospora yangpuensis TaxID=683228 RepID=A0A1C6ULS1_9ACTN|nr:hypothetical protein [Micromonospora yangpuensis]GGM17966.1 hypothetical protein GCM10012279_40180 [Micromonospora yangpuensis]SCL54928.1 hypothetical protein GA0070617_2808 [Micromonospora yangpuensis]